MSELLSFDVAFAKLMTLASPVGSERIAIELARARVLAEDIRAPVSLPRFDQSAMDGYAVRIADLPSEGDWELSVSGESKAGDAPTNLPPGSAFRIFTGAPLPFGADTVVMQENVSRESERVRSSHRPSMSDHVRRCGEDLKEGDVALSAGLRVRPGHIALLASLDFPSVVVARRPRVTVVGTGNELRSPGARDRPGSIAESNGYFVKAMGEAVGADVAIAPFVPDDLEIATRSFAEALATSDLVVTIGGVSVGDHDVVRPALERAGVDIAFYKVAMKPGKPLTVGTRGRTVVLGLPGNPASASMTFLLFGVPLLGAMSSLRGDALERAVMTVRGSYARKPGRREFVRARLAREGARLVVVPLRNQASGAVTSFADADALIVVEETSPGFADGGEVDVLLIPG